MHIKQKTYLALLGYFNKKTTIDHPVESTMLKGLGFFVKVTSKVIGTKLG